MSVFWKPILLGLLLSSLAFACTLDPICEDGEPSECIPNSDGTVVYRICKNAAWDENKCGLTEICLKNDGCVAQVDYCQKTGNQCLDVKTAKICAEIGRSKLVECGKDFFCDADACSNGKECCVDQDICLDLSNTCFDKNTLKICVKGAVPILQICSDGAGCEDGLCVGGEVYKCDETYSASCDSNVALTCANHRILRTDCGNRVCKAGVCAEDLCVNHRYDAGETAVDCGGDCVPCATCRVDADCGVNGFCDSAFGYVCSKRCRMNADCVDNDLWDGEFCRGDGRCSPKVFETVWVVTDKDSTVILPFDAIYRNAKCNFQVLWGDEVDGTDITTRPRVSDCSMIANRTHNYKKAGEYKVKIIGIYDGWGAFDKINTSKGDLPLTPVASMLRAVSSFGPVGLSRGAFYGSHELRLMPVKDIPDALKLNSLGNAFTLASSFNAPIGHWDTSSVTDMSNMFGFAGAFNQALGAWNVLNVQVMSYMFTNAKVFNQDLTAWKLHGNVDLFAVFNGTSMSDSHLCALNAKGGAWESQWEYLGQNAVCK